MDFNGLKVHFVGIGGIGVSGLARFLKAQGAIVSGSDIVDTSIIQDLRNEGIEINIPHAQEVIKEKDVIIHSAIIKDSNVEILESKRLHKQILSRKDALKILLAKKKVLSICAAHGKSSTSAILASILQESGAIIGAISKEFHSNVRVSKSDWLVFEADESDRSFLNSNPYKSIIINAEAEHLESYHHNFEELKDAYLDFMKLSQEVVLNLECKTLQELLMRLQQSTDKKIPKTLTLNPKKDIKNVSYILQDNKPYTTFELLDFGEFSVYGIGYHNAINASIAILSALDLLDMQTIKQNLLKFQGIKKRFDVLQHLSNVTPCIIDDYAHHPTEIKATLAALRIYQGLLKDSVLQENDLRIIAIFQPHKYSRLRDNLEAFCECFKDCDELVILPVWAAGEQKIDFDFATLFKQYNPIFATRIRRDKHKILLCNANNEVIKTLDSGIIIGLGAGDITYQLRGDK